MSDEKDQSKEEEAIPKEVDVHALGACTKCDCKKFVLVNGSIKCGRSTCGHPYSRHSD